MCPDERQLLALVQGTAPDAASLSAHVASCETCQFVVGALQKTAPRAPSLDVLPDPDTVLIGRYRVVATLGQGAMGVVFRCFDQELQRDIAVKMVRASTDASTRRLGLEEARSLARLNHPHVVAVYDAFTWGPWDAIAMEYVVGQDLRAWARTPHPRAEIQRVLEQAALGLEAAHRAGIVHRDLKPENVLIGKDGRVRVSDFGLSRSHARLSPGDALATTPAGTPAYMAPELLTGAAATQASDQWALCLTAIELLTGARTPDTSLRLMPWARGVQPAPADRWPSLTELVAALARRRRRKQVTLFVSLAALAAVVTLVVAQLRPPPPAAGCAALRTKLEGLRAESSLSAFDASLDGRAPPSTRTRSMQLLREHLSGLDTLLTEACQSERDPARAQLLSLRVECLHRLTEGISSLQVKVSSDDAMASRLAFQMLHFDPRARCGDDRRVRAQAMTAETVTGANDVMRDTVALKKAFDEGDFETVRRDLEGLISRAHAAHVVKPIPSLLAMRAALHFDAGEAEAAHADLDEAISIAETEGLDLASLTLSMARLAYARTQQEADMWTEMARLRARRIGVEAIEEGNLLESAGHALLGLGLYEAGAERFHRAAAVWRQQLTPDDLIVAQTEQNEAGALTDLGRFDEAAALLDRSRTAITAATRPGDEEALDAAFVRLRLELLRERAPDAKALLEHVRPVANEANAARLWVAERWLGSLEGRAAEATPEGLAEDEELALELTVVERLEQVHAAAKPPAAEAAEGESSPMQWLATALAARIAARRGEPEATALAQRVLAAPEGSTGRLARAHALAALGRTEEARALAVAGTRLAAELGDRK